MKKGLLLPVMLVITIKIFAQGENERIRAKAFAAADKIEAKCIEWRKDFHQNPELGNREFRTSKIIAAHLKSLGIETKENVAKTGVVGILRGGQPGPCIALRADIDALPVTERVNIPFASKQKATYNGQEVGVMHADERCRNPFRNEK